MLALIDGMTLALIDGVTLALDPLEGVTLIEEESEEVADGLTDELTASEELADGLSHVAVPLVPTRAQIGNPAPDRAVGW
jgi:hypothetical protein